mgnify:CR=1 FL=1
MLLWSMDFRSRLREEIEYSGKLYKDVAAEAGITKSTMDSYVGSQGSMPAADIAVRLAQVLGVSVEYLVTGNGAENTISKKDFHILSCLKKLPEHERKALEQYIENLSKGFQSKAGIEN